MIDERQRTKDEGRKAAFGRLAVLLFCAAALAASVALAFATLRDLQTQTRGVTYGAMSETRWGVNVALEQYSDADLARVIRVIREAGLTLVRQHFYWNAIEPRRNEFAWTRWDRLVDTASASGLELVAVLDTSPEWARSEMDRPVVTAPPADVNDYARFVAAFVTRYGERVRHIQIWDNPNVHPFWGRRNADPLDYAALLRAGATSARAVDPRVRILAAGLAPNGELIRGHPDYSDVLFLRGLYQAGAREDFDIVAVKPYGMWSGPEDRRVDKDVFNFSRAILLREEMLAYGDAAKPVWAVEFGWNALPADWRGAPSPWGTDTEAVQSARLADAVARARSEWAWMPVLIAQTFQPNAPADDPLWGFALVDKNLQPRPLFDALTRAIAAPVQPATFDWGRAYAMLATLALVALVGLWRGALAFWQLPFERVGETIAARFAALPELAQGALVAASALALYSAPNVILSVAFLALVVCLFALRLDLGLAITVLAIPFYLFPKTLIGGMQFSMVELLTLAAVAGWAWRMVARFKFQVWGLNLKLETRDWAIILFVLLGLVSVLTADNFGVASREFRVIVLEPALLYALIRASSLTRRELWRLADAFILSAVAVSLIGLYQFCFTDWVIVGEGVRRVLAVYGSPNNLALYLDRALPLAMALALWQEEKKRLAYALAAIPIALALYLTYSRGAWLGLAAGFAFIGLMSGRRVRLALVALVVLGLALAIPFLQTERAQSLFQIGTGTGFFRVSVWESGVAMIRDHPLFGVGLDNFLYEYPKYINPAAWREPNLSHPHNLVLDFWVRLGALGVVALGWMLFEFYRAGQRIVARSVSARALAIGLMAGMTAALAHGMIDAAYFYVDLAFVWMLTCATIAQLDR